MKATERFLEATKEIWEAYNTHPFILGLLDGTLDRDKFRYYIIQDYLYLEDYAKTFAIGVAKATSLQTANLFAKYIAVMNGELDVHKGYLARLGVTREEIDRTPRALDNLSYTSYMLRIAYEGGEAEIMAAILSCAYSYEMIAKELVRRAPACADDPFYGDWIKGYASERYANDNKVLLDEMDRLAADCSEAQLRHLTEIFVACSRYEMAFWEMGWTKKP
ncbi:MAG: thiaminase II [Lachnospiraceae bacterium]|nr:thiaminase II [Lachnospiraceae bacterium]